MRLTLIRNSIVETSRWKVAEQWRAHKVDDLVCVPASTAFLRSDRVYSRSVNDRSRSRDDRGLLRLLLGFVEFFSSSRKKRDPYLFATTDRTWVAHRQTWVHVNVEAVDIATNVEFRELFRVIGAVCLSLFFVWKFSCNYCILVQFRTFANIFRGNGA